MAREYKDSGIEWIGKIPKEWKIAKYKFFANSRMGETILSEDTSDEGIPIYSATQDSKIFGYINNPKLLLKKGDFVIPARGNSIGCTSIVKEEIASNMIEYHYFAKDNNKTYYEMNYSDFGSGTASREST